MAGGARRNATPRTTSDAGSTSPAVEASAGRTARQRTGLFGGRSPLFHGDCDLRFHRGRFSSGPQFRWLCHRTSCAFVAGEGRSHSRPRYDEQFADFSPGRCSRWTASGSFRRCRRALDDSCAAPDNFSSIGSRNDRKTIQSLAVGGGALGELVVSAAASQWATRRS